MSGRLPAMAFLASALLALIAPARMSVAEDQVSARVRFGGAHVYVLRGFMNLSPGLDEFAGKVQDRGVPVTVANGFDWSAFADHAVHNYRTGRLRSIAIVGHSMGGGAALDLAAALGEAGVPVNLVVLLDGVGRTEVPANVRRVVNFYVADGVGSPVHGVGRNNGTIRNISESSVDHFSIIAAHERELLALVMGVVRPASASSAGAKKGDGSAPPPAASAH